MTWNTEEEEVFKMKLINFVTPLSKHADSLRFYCLVINIGTYLYKYFIMYQVLF